MKGTPVGAVVPRKHWQPYSGLSRVDVDVASWAGEDFLLVSTFSRARDTEIKNEALKHLVELQGEDVPKRRESGRPLPSGTPDTHPRSRAHAAGDSACSDPEPLTAIAFAGVAAIAWALTQLLALFT